MFLRSPRREPKLDTRPAVMPGVVVLCLGVFDDRVFRPPPPSGVVLVEAFLEIAAIGRLRWHGEGTVPGVRAQRFLR